MVPVAFIVNAQEELSKSRAAIEGLGASHKAWGTTRVFDQEEEVARLQELHGGYQMQDSSSNNRQDTVVSGCLIQMHTHEQG